MNILKGNNLVNYLIRDSPFKHTNSVADIKSTKNSTGLQIKNEIIGPLKNEKYDRSSEPET